MIWDFQVFNQIWIMRDGQPDEDYFLMAVYSFVESFKVSEYGLGSAIAVVMVAIMFVRHVRLHPPDGADRGGAMSATSPSRPPPLRTRIGRSPRRAPLRGAGASRAASA